MTNSKVAASIQFFRGKVERKIPIIKLTRSKDGRKGLALFIFDQAEALKIEDMSKINTMIMEDEEGQLIAKEIKIELNNDTQQTIEAKYKWKSDEEFKRFMRFAESYAKVNGLSNLETTMK
tara:strand:- start:1 stop:363 length:363 start_codon:yes stop_codon:yes gene_type:complete